MSKILYIISGRSFNSNSLGRKISEVIKCWKETVEQVDVICGGDLTQTQVSKTQPYGSQAYFNKSHRSNKWLVPFVTSASELKDIIHDIKFYFAIKFKCSKTKYDVVWERSSRLHIAGLLLAKKNKIPFVLEWKDNLVNYPLSLFKPIALLVEKYKIKHADYIVVESEVLKLYISGKGISADRIFVAYNGVNSNEFVSKKQPNLIKEKLGLSRDDILAGYLGSYAFYHNPHLLIEAAKVSYLSNTKIKYLLVGNGMYYNECVDLATSYGLINNNVFFIDGVPKEEVPAILTAIDIAVLPGSTDIICPIKVFEYMSSEKPVVIPNYKCNEEVIEHMVNGILFEPLSAIDFHNKVSILSSDENLREKLAKKARQSVKEKYSWNATWGNTLSLIITESQRTQD